MGTVSAFEPFVVPAPPAAPGIVTLSKKQRALVAYIEHNPKFAAFATAAELAKRVGVHPATVVRLAQLLGYEGFPELQQTIRHRYLASLDAVSLMHAYAEERHGDIVLAQLDQDLRNLSATRGTLDRDELRRVARLILNARSVLIVGAGSHGGLALIFAHLCRFMGLPVEAELRGTVALATRLAGVGPGDVVIGTAAWVVVRETREALAVAHERGATTVAIVDNRASALAQVADHVFVTRTESVSFFQSMSGPLAVLNALVAELASSAEARLCERMRASMQVCDRLGVPWQGVTTPIEICEHGDAAAEDNGLAQAGQRREQDTGASPHG